MKTVKWAAIVFAALVLILVGAMLIVPLFVDLQGYKPEIEKQVSAATGRPFTIGGEIELSLFPWAGVALSDLHLGNPPGFKEKDMLSVKSFDVRLKLLPLLSRDVQVTRFVVEAPRVVVEKRKDGKLNWEGMGPPTAEATAPKGEAGRVDGKEGAAGALPIKGLAASEMAVRDGTLLWIDETRSARKEVRGIQVGFEDVSLDRPIRLTLSADLEGSPLLLEGRVGPLGREMGKGSIPLDLGLKLFKELSLNLKGSVSDALEQPKFDLAMEIAPFSPRKIADTLGRPFPAVTADPDALTRVGLKARVKGTPSSVSLSDGVIDLDQSRITFSGAAKEFAKPDVVLRIKVDQIDVDRYLPPAAGKKTGDQPPAPGPEKKRTEYEPLRRLAVDAVLEAGKLKLMGAQVQDVLMKVRGEGGVFVLDSLGLKAYEGSATIKGNLDVRAERPKARLELETSGVRLRPLLNDMVKKDFLEGTAGARLALSMEGEGPDTIKRTLNGEGDLRLTDGAIIGIDLPGMVRNVKTAFGAERPAERPKTDFSEILAPFTVRNGLVHTPATSMASPLLRVVASGDADLVRETLDLRVEPKVVTTLKGQQDTKERSGLMIPVLITGTFSSPSFAPDLKGMLESEIRERLKSPGVLKDMPGPSSPADRAKDLFDLFKK